MTSRCVPVLATLLACGGSSNEAAALGAAALHIAETGAYVALEGGCWGDCGFGTRCNPSTHLCEPYKEAEDPGTATTVQPAPLSVCALSMKPGGACSEADTDCLLDAACATVCTCEADAKGDGLTWACAGPPCEAPLRPVR
jgi:hypothetical protein